MVITKDVLEQRLAQLTAEREQAVGAVNSYNGAIAQVQWDLLKIKEIEATAIQAEVAELKAEAAEEEHFHD